MLPLRILSAVVLAVSVMAAAVGGEGNTLTLTLERANHEGIELSQLRLRDQVRHSKLLQKQPAGVVDFPLEGNIVNVGLYFTRVKLGTPPKEFYVQIDTGSDVLWVNCNPCSSCPTSSGIQIPLEFFVPSSSTSVSLISCSDQRCALGAEFDESTCLGKNQCGYQLLYGDGSGTSGYYVSDLMSLDTVVGNSLTSNSSASVVFGCSTSVTGNLKDSGDAVDGIFGFGQNPISVISQLSSQGIIPKSFSHCLSGENGGGGILVLAQIVEPNIVYTPLVPSQLHYNVNLQSIAVNGQTLPINPSVFGTSDNQGTIIDSGTTLAYLAEEAYDPFVTAITQTVSQSVRPHVLNGFQCYRTVSSVSDIFPPVSLNFAGGASMVLRPQDYLLQQNSAGDAAVWCIGIQKFKGQQMTILGDLVLQNKIVVYDLAGQRIGWVNYNCSSPVNVNTTSGIVYVKPGQIGNSNSARHKPRN